MGCNVLALVDTCMYYAVNLNVFSMHILPISGRHVECNALEVIILECSFAV